MVKKATNPSFETALNDLESIVARLESGDLPLDSALAEFEKGIQLARLAQQQLQQAEQRVQILLSDDSNGQLTPYQQDIADDNRV